ncbi:CDC48 family AAA ATPase [Candidatus Woesearchaeota archaeon]|nr:CDC48 family AAA ATPase [Candidatus Woesearchaeota archaeon]
MDEPKEIKLKVMEAVQDDVNKGIVKIDSSYMRQMRVNPGDVVEIKGERITAALVDRAYPGDIGLNIIRMDGNTRRNAKTSIGEIVYVKKAEVKPAKKVVIAPATRGIVVNAPPMFFKQGLVGKALVKGDLVALRKARRTFRLVNAPGRGDDIFSILENQFPGFGFGDLKFFVVDTLPKKEIVVITEETEIELNPHTEEIKEEEEAVTSLGINYEDIGGLREEIRKIQEMVELPLRHPEIFEKLGIEAPKGLLLHGPPGTGKTLLAKAVASETNSHFILINGPEIMSKFYGESEANLRKKFEEAEQNAPSIIFFDEIDAIATKREETRGDVEKRVVAQLLGLMDGLKSRGKVIVIAATNMPNLLDPALRRPGRFDREIELGVPDKRGRFDILKIHTRNMPLEGSLYGDIVTKEIPLAVEQRLNSVEQEVKDKGEEISACKVKMEMTNKQDEVKQLKLKLEELEEKKKKADESLIARILQNITGLGREVDNLNREMKLKERDLDQSNAKIHALNSSIDKSREVISRLRKICQELAASQPKLLSLAEEVIALDKAGQSYPSEDPRKKINENQKGEFYQELEKAGLLEVIKQKAKQERDSINRDIDSIARITHGFVGADLSALSKEAAMVVLRRILPDLKLEGKESDRPLSKETLEKLVIRLEDFQEALKAVRPSAMREVLVEKPDVSWNDIGGLDEVKNRLKEAVEWPLKNPEMFKNMGIRPPRGVLLYGPPGTGKTMLAKAVAKESEANFILINGPSLLSKWVGESEKAVREVFRKARLASPTILFFDELDALAPRRGTGEGEGNKVSDKIVNQMLTEMDGLEGLKDVLVLAATNRPDILDPALLRQGRFDRIIYTSIPDLESRRRIFEVHLSKLAFDVESTPKPEEKVIRAKAAKTSKRKKSEAVTMQTTTEGTVSIDKQEIIANLAQELAEKTEGYVGSDIEGVCREAAMIALRENLNAKGIRREHLLRALEVVKPSVDKDTEEAYRELENYFSSARAKQIKEKLNRADYFG